MNHETAENLLLGEKYLLNELSQQERSSFEEHLFDCPICSDRVRRDFTVIENLKEVLREDCAPAANPVSRRTSWRAWLTLPSLVPAAAAVVFACLAAYQFSLNKTLETAHILPRPAAVLMPVARGDNGNAIHLDRRRPLFEIEVKGDSARPDSFGCDFQNSTGASVLALQSDRQPGTDFTLRFELPAKHFPAGTYQLVLRPASEPDRIITYPFVIEDSK